MACRLIQTSRIEECRANTDRDGNLNGYPVRRQHWFNPIPGDHRRSTGDYPLRAGTTACSGVDRHIYSSSYQPCSSWRWLPIPALRIFHACRLSLPRMGFFPASLPAWVISLVFTNGIISLAIATGVLIILFGGKSHLLSHSLQLGFSWRLRFHKPGW